MKKTTFLIPLLMLFGTVSSWGVDIVTTTVDDYYSALTSGGVYLIQGAGSGNRGYYVVGGETSGYAKHTTSPYSDAYALFQFVSSDTEGQYYIYCVGAQKYLSYVDTSEGNMKVQLVDNATDSNTSWQILDDEGGTSGVIDIVPGSTDTSGSSYISWNIHGGVSQTEYIGLYSNTDGNSKWALEACSADNARNVAILSANTVLNTRGVGYPTTDSEAYTTLAAAISTASSYATDAVTADHVKTLDEAVTTYKAATEGIQMPEDGKAYTFTNVSYETGTKWYLNYTDGEYTPTQLTDGATIPISAYFICRVVDGGYVFVNNDGVYLKYLDSLSSTGTTAYDATSNLIHVEKLVHGDNVTPENEDLFGYTAIYASKNGSARYITIRAAGTYPGLDGVYFSVNSNGVRLSSAFLIEEVSYPNNVTLAPVDNVAEASNLGTFSAPFATLIPSGVSAYFAKESPTADAEVTLTRIKSGIVPANQGVILASDGTVTSARMLPVTSESTDEATAEIADNQLGNSAGASHTIEETDNAYVLAAPNSARYVKLYVERNASNTQGCFFGFSKLTLGNSEDDTQYVTLTFNRETPSSTTSDVTVTATTAVDSEGVAASLSEFVIKNSSGTEVTAGYLVNGNLSTQANAAGILCPNQNIGSGNTASFTFLLEGIPAGYSFDEASITTHGINSSGGAQNTSNTARYFDITISQGTSAEDMEVFTFFENKDICTSATSSWESTSYNYKDFSETASTPVTINGTAGFYTATVGSTLAMNKAYLVMSSTSNAIKMAFDNGEVTGIDEVKVSEQSDGMIRDLSGRIVKHAAKGIYIVNGKKLYVK